VSNSYWTLKLDSLDRLSPLADHLHLRCLSLSYKHPKWRPLHFSLPGMLYLSQELDSIW
jgi:hypothetical protein